MGLNGEVQPNTWITTEEGYICMALFYAPKCVFFNENQFKDKSYFYKKSYLHHLYFN